MRRLFETERKQVLATYQMGRDPWGDWWINVSVDGRLHDSLGPFRTKEACNAAYTDLLDLGRAIGAVDQPKGGH